MKRLSYLLFSLALLGLMQLPVFGQAKKDDSKGKIETKTVEAPKAGSCCAPAGSYRHLDGRPLVFVANGAGNSTTCSDNLVEINGDKLLGLRIQMVPWCKQNALYPDLVDQDAQLNAATRLACMVTGIRKECPHSQIFFVGHSAGTRVVLAAAEMLPEKSIDRIILLASAVSCTYDLKPALKTSRYGIDNFWSDGDGVLETAVENRTTSDGLKVPCAGLVGFRVYCKEDAAAYCNVRQYKWNLELAGAGGHFAWTNHHNMRKCIAPLFSTFPAVYEAPAPAARKKMPPATAEKVAPPVIDKKMPYAK